MSDAELLDREGTDRSAYLKLERPEPRALGTTYRVIHTSPVQLDAWRRWTKSGVALSARGLTPRASEQLEPRSA